jgi:hypothetical protein
MSAADTKTNSKASEEKPIGEDITDHEFEKEKAICVKEDKNYEDWKTTREAKLIQDYLRFAMKKEKTQHILCCRRENNIKYNELNAEAPSHETLMRFCRDHLLILEGPENCANVGWRYKFVIDKAAVEKKKKLAKSYFPDYLFY